MEASFREKVQALLLLTCDVAWLCLLQQIFPAAFPVRLFSALPSLRSTHSCYRGTLCRLQRHIHWGQPLKEDGILQHSVIRCIHLSVSETKQQAGAIIATNFVWFSLEVLTICCIRAHISRFSSTPAQKRAIVSTGNTVRGGAAQHKKTSSTPVCVRVYRCGKWT